jgi:hypothetical protein
VAGRVYGAKVASAAAFLFAASLTLGEISELRPAVDRPGPLGELGLRASIDETDQLAFQILPLPLLPPEPSATAEPAERMLAAVPDDVEPYFDLYLYVSKAPKGSLAQHMYVFERNGEGLLEHRFTWPVSTGRERSERDPSGNGVFTTTPTGLYKLDPGRFFRKWRSRRWNANMPWTIFLEYSFASGRQTGIAVHSATGGKIERLGRRDSGGCIRLAPENAQFLYETIQRRYAGLVPVFARDPDGGHTSKAGLMLRDRDGNPVLRSGYRVLLLIEDFPGSEQTGPVLVAFND